MGAKKPESRSISLYRDTNCHPSARERISPLPLPVLSVLCRELNDLAQWRKDFRLLLVRLHGAVHCADVPVNDADRLAGIAGVFCFPFADLDALNEQPQQFRRQRVNRCVLLCLTDSNLNHTGIYLYSKGKIMIHLTFDYKTDEKCTTPGQYLKYHRTFQGLSTRELAEKVGIVPATLVLYENDRHPIKYSTAVALANVLGIDRNRLLDEYTAFVDYPYFSLLKKVRQDLSLTQIQMAELIGIGQTSYSGWEREIRVPRRKEYDKILAALKKLRVNVDTYLCQSASI